jgi:hypothetical protein
LPILKIEVETQRQQTAQQLTQEIDSLKEQLNFD